MLDETPPAAPILDSKPAGLEPMQLETNNSSGNSESPAQSSSSSASKKQSLNSTPSCSVPSTLSVGEDNDNRLQPPNSNASIEGRIEYVLSCAQQAGFDSLDSLVTAYYVREFRQSSTLSVEQRMSRHRRLPQLLAELRQGSTNWSAWERNGYEDEILRAAEDVCGAEYSQFIRRDNSAVEESVIGDLQANGGLPMPQGSFQDNVRYKLSHPAAATFHTLLPALPPFNLHCPWKTLLCRAAAQSLTSSCYAYRFFADLDFSTVVATLMGFIDVANLRKHVYGPSRSLECRSCQHAAALLLGACTARSDHIMASNLS